MVASQSSRAALAVAAHAATHCSRLGAGEHARTHACAVLTTSCRHIRPWLAHPAGHELGGAPQPWRQSWSDATHVCCAPLNALRQLLIAPRRSCPV